MQAQWLREIHLAILTMERSELGNSNPAPRECGERPSGKVRGRLISASAVRIVVAIALALAMARPASLFAQAKPPTEYEIKAAFLYNFAKFVEWPPTVFRGPKVPLNICVFGRDPFGRALDDALLGKAIGDHPATLERARQISELASCHIVFISGGESPRLAEVLGSLRGRNVLLVGETEGFASAGGVIQFVLDENRVRFAINPDAANRAGLKISSKLLALATIVHDAARNSEGKN
jgi:hypothetical protein